MCSTYSFERWGEGVLYSEQVSKETFLIVKLLVTVSTGRKRNLNSRSEAFIRLSDILTTEIWRDINVPQNLIPTEAEPENFRIQVECSIIAELHNRTDKLTTIQNID